MKKNDFEYNYSAPTAQERKEIERIKNSYTMQKQDDKLLRLKKLDKKVKDLPTMFSLIVGIVGLLIFGLGFSMILEWNIFIWGTLVSVLGFATASLAYFVYLKSSKYFKNKYKDEIIKLSDELLNNEDK